MLNQLENNLEQSTDFDYPFTWDETKYLDGNQFKNELETNEASTSYPKAVVVHSFLRI